MYADNAQAVEFYGGRGFVEASRSETDDAGLPFALVNMEMMAAKSRPD